jgi:hypothetical protein
MRKRMQVGSRLPMKRIAAAILLLSTHATHATTLCQDTQGREQGVHWSWREIEGRRCWFKRQGPMPPNSELRWRTKEEVREAVARVEAPPTAAQPQGPSIRMLKAQILWEGISEVAANWIDGDAPVDLMRGDDLSGPAGVGGNWVVPAYRVNAGESTSFAVRFAPVIELRQAGTN